jgi:hypothetical protein
VKLSIFSIIYICILIVCLNATVAFSETMPKEQQDFINSLTLEELYDFYADVVMFTPPKHEFNRQLFKNNPHGVKRCIVSSLRITFTKQEMRNLFIKPEGLDMVYYNNKIAQLVQATSSCFRSIQN